MVWIPELEGINKTRNEHYFRVQVPHSTPSFFGE